ncbi:MAG: ubiquinol-cytochrome c reductase cytochrome b subunit [Actinomycetota bacterium]|nr:ubiquinol-cytochrome c reductase cytochrome b subunit [Actinomycetota bacterium]
MSESSEHSGQTARSRRKGPHRLARWIDDRLGTTRFGRSALNKVFPDHWSFLLGEVAMYCLVILVLTGVFLSFFYDASTEEVFYRGDYRALHGVPMSEAYRSVVRLSWDVRAGLVMRQIHHWAALLFVAAIIAHLCRVFFTGAFRRPRELNWMVGVTLLLLAVANGFTGYSLPDDLLSGTGLHIAYSVVLGIPVVGPWLAFLFFGGEFPANEILSRLYVMHILLIPGLIVALLVAHLAILWRQKHTQFPGPGRSEGNVVGSYLWPNYTAKSLGMLFLISAVLATLGGLAQINPVWLYGPFHPEIVTTAAQPDWYVGWLEGALRLFPPWEPRAFGYTLPNAFFPGALLPGLTFALLYLWPFLEARFTKDRQEHHLLDRPRDRPVRSAIGAGVLTFYLVLTAAGGQDILAQKLNLSIAAVLWGLRLLLVALPLAVAVLTYRLCRDRAAAERLEHEKEEARRRVEAAGTGGRPHTVVAPTSGE